MLIFFPPNSPVNVPQHFLRQCGCSISDFDNGQVAVKLCSVRKVVISFYATSCHANALRTQAYEICYARVDCH